MRGGAKNGFFKRDFYARLHIAAAGLALLAAPSGVVGTPFGLTLYAAVDSGGTRAVASALLQASPPADRLARGLAQRIPSDEVTEGLFEFRSHGRCGFS